MKSRQNIINIAAVGDIMLGISSVHALTDEDNLPNSIKRDPKLCMRDIQWILDNADIRFGNLECLISKQYEDYPEKEKQLMVAPIEALDVLAESGFDILNIANNHILDHGIELVKETIDNIRSKCIEYIGAPGALDGKRYKTYIVKNKKIGFLGFNLCKTGEYTQPSVIYDTIINVRKEVDYLILSLHWGDGYEHISHPAPSQIQLAHSFADHGADIIIGHHSHVLQPVENYNGKIIAYSLGNFIFDMWREQNRQGAVLKIQIDCDSDIFTPKLIPTKIVQNRVIFDSERHDEVQLLMTSTMTNSMDEDEYSALARRVKRRHNIEIVLHYAKICYKLPLAVHKATLLRWIQKVIVGRWKEKSRNFEDELFITGGAE